MMMMMLIMMMLIMIMMMMMMIILEPVKRCEWLLLLTTRPSHGWPSIELPVLRLEISAVVNLSDKDKRFAYVTFVSCISSDRSVCC